MDQYNKYVAMFQWFIENKTMSRIQDQHQQISTTKLQQKCFCLDFTSMDHNILKIAVLLKGNLLHFKVPTSKSSMLWVSWVQFQAPSVTNHSIFYNRFVVLWSKYNDPVYTTICSENCICSIIEKSTWRLCSRS